MPIALSGFVVSSPAAGGASTYVRVNQVGYEAAGAPFQAYLMSTASESGATFSVINSKGATVYSAAIGTWASPPLRSAEGKHWLCSNVKTRAWR